MKTLRLILGDQLNYRHSWYKTIDDDVHYIIMEMGQETGYVLHHAQKLIGFFAAMYNFAAYLRRRGHKVTHLLINDKENTQDLCANLDHFIRKWHIEQLEYQLPDEYRLDEQLKAYTAQLSIPSVCADTEHFLTTRDELRELFAGKKQWLMENFYHYMRRKHGILMDGAQPEGGKWNYDANNREPYKGADSIPVLPVKTHDFSDIWKEIQKAGIPSFGEPCAEAYPWPVTRKAALQWLHFFIKHMLPVFGRYQDAMSTASWTLFHSRLSFALNTKMLSPREVIDAALKEWRNNKDTVHLSQVEGFVRQILGWREFMRGIYWAKMPGYANMNFLDHRRRLPGWYWTGDTRMNCLKHAITQSLQHAYAHHIQRLMITGNFALLAGVQPAAVDEWYLGIYIDAIEWVEITNTRGMSQFADGGIAGTKPYVSAAAYISRMSNYCSSCHYRKDKKTGDKACPFNSLYWNFFDRHRDKLQDNPRIGMVYRTLDKMKPADVAALLEQAQYYLQHIDKL